MRAENPAALPYILQDDIYLLQSDKAAFKAAAPQAIESIVAESVASIPVETKRAEQITTIPSLAPPAETKPTAQPTVTQTPAPAYNYLGGNKKYFLVLTSYATEDFIAADHLAALQNIMTRKGYGLDDLAILNVAKTNGTIIDLVGYFKPERVLILGEAAVPAGMGVPPLNQPKKMKNGLLLRSFSFDDMMSSNDNKKAFWDQMKNF